MRVIGVALVLAGLFVVLGSVALFGFVGWWLVAAARHGVARVSRTVHEEPPPVRQPTDAEAAAALLREAGYRREVSHET